MEISQKHREILKLKVHPVTIWRVLVKYGINHLNSGGIKPIKRLVAKHPNDLWQADIMGKVKFPQPGVMYLIATIDDHSRFIPSGKWFRKQTKINVFRVWYHALCHYGLPKAMLQDRGSQYKAHRGQADYQYFFWESNLSSPIRRGLRVRSKGSGGSFPTGILDGQRDFVRENLDVTSLRS